MKKVIGYLLAFMVFTCLSCVDTKNNKLIIGYWTGSQWTVNGKPSANKATGTHFSFDSTGNYLYEYPGYTEKGSYKVEHDMLFSTPFNQREIMVKILKLTADSLVFEMNREGQAEQLTLIKN